MCRETGKKRKNEAFRGLWFQATATRRSFFLFVRTNTIFPGLYLCRVCTQEEGRMDLLFDGLVPWGPHLEVGLRVARRAVRPLEPVSLFCCS